MWDEFWDFDLFRDVPSIDIPAWFIVGENDYSTYTELVEEFNHFMDAHEGK